MVRQIRPSALPPQVQARRQQKAKESTANASSKAAASPDLPPTETQGRRRTTSPVPSTPKSSGVRFPGPRRPSDKPASENLVPNVAVTDISAQMGRQHKDGASAKERAQKTLVYLQIGVQNTPPTQHRTHALLGHLEKLAHQVADAVNTGKWDRADVALFSRLVHAGLNRAKRATPDGPQALWYERYFVAPLKTQHLETEILKLF